MGRAVVAMKGAVLLPGGLMVAATGTFEPAQGWQGDHHDAVPIWVLSRRPVPVWVNSMPLVTYTNDIASAFREAARAAGDKDVLVHGAATAQRAIAAGLLDQIEIHLVPVLLGAGRRLFEGSTFPRRELERIRVLSGEGGVTHLRFRARY